MEEKDWLQLMSEENQLRKVLQTNQYTKVFGLTLSEEDAQLLVQERGTNLREQQRVEFGEGILARLAVGFCDSPNIWQENYVEMLGRLQEIFYLYKNESMDELTDDELIAYMREKFDGVCHGDPDYLEDTVLEDFARSIRARTRKYIGRYRREGE